MRKKRILISGIGLIITLGIMYGTPWGIPGITQFDSHFKLLDMQFSYSLETVTQMLNHIGVEGIQHYLSYLGVDMIFIIMLVIFQTNISCVAADKVPNLRIWLVCFAIGRMVFDFMEDGIIARMLNGIIPINTYNVRTASICTSFKFIMLYLWCGVFVITLLYKKIHVRK